ncbi:hypothetical protein TrLO_g2277 [Triparma laevis f. longispina]|uniref:DIX domain-containing protein n=1 Tax=Triparma laevis f. longispina TaxID=1714387 RepID=A0A9W7A9I6_9STRA|nr:hypothetical protein TrLO_g2277 [Triparma laevis f. longispina]
MTTIRYFIPSDGDDESHPNIFLHPLPPPYTLSHLQSHFPLPGHFHWRLKTNLGKGHVWLDVVNFDAKIPSFKGTSGEVFVAKLTRLEEGGSANNPTQQRQQRQTQPEVVQSAPKSPNRAAPRPSLEVRQPTVVDVPAKKVEQKQETLLFDVDESAPSTTPPPSSHPPASDFLNAPTSDTDELLTIGLTASAPPPTNQTRLNRGVSAPVQPVTHDPFGSSGDASVLKATPVSAPIQQQQQQQQNGMQSMNNGMGRGVNPNVQQGNFGAFDAFNMNGNGMGRGRGGGHRNSTWN